MVSPRPNSHPPGRVSPPLGHHRSQRTTRRFGSQSDDDRACDHTRIAVHPARHRCWPESPPGCRARLTLAPAASASSGDDKAFQRALHPSHIYPQESGRRARPAHVGIRVALHGRRPVPAPSRTEPTSLLVSPPDRFRFEPLPSTLADRTVAHQRRGEQPCEGGLARSGNPNTTGGAPPKHRRGQPTSM